MPRCDVTAALPLLLTFGTLLAVPAVCEAQPPTAGGLPPSAAGGTLAGGNEIIELEGTFQGAAGRIIKVEGENESEIYVQLPTDPTKVTFRADADPQMIRPGLTVRFEAEFGPNGLPTAPISGIDIIRPLNVPGMSRAAKASLTPGIYPAKGGQPKRPNPVFVPGRYRVVGNLLGVAPGMMAVAAGNKPIRIQLADDAVFVIRFNTLELAQPGDQVKVAGFYRPPDKSKIRAETVEVSTERVIGEAMEQPRRRGRRRGNAAAGRAAEAGNEAAAGKDAAEPDPFAPR